MIGDGDITDDLKALAAEYSVDVKFPGKVDHDKIPDRLRNADLFVLPSLNEGMSNSVLEAMACGLPIIATDIGGSRELIKENGYIVSKASVSNLVETIGNYLDNEVLLKRHGTKSRILAQGMDWYGIARQYEEYYRK